MTPGDLDPTAIIVEANERGCTLTPYWRGRVYRLCQEVTRLRAIQGVSEARDATVRKHLDAAATDLASLARKMEGG